MASLDPQALHLNILFSKYFTEKISARNSQKTGKHQLLSMNTRNLASSEKTRARHGNLVPTLSTRWHYQLSIVYALGSPLAIYPSKKGYIVHPKKNK